MAQLPATSGIDRSHRRVIFASSLGTVFEWYDFYLYGSLAALISKQFFSGVNETTGFIFALLAFAAGFSDACALGAIRDDGKCQRLQEASAGASVTVTLPAGVLEAALVDYTADAIDDEICQTDMASTGGPPGF